jgi:hypothetical protein
MADYEMPTHQLTNVTPSSPQEKAVKTNLSYEALDQGDDADDIDSTSTRQSGTRPGGSTSTDAYTGTRLQSMPRKLLIAWILAGFSAIWIGFTIVFTFNCSSQTPFAFWLLPASSENTLLVLNILAHGTVLLLGALASQVFETVHWGLASSENGIPADSFLALSRATGFLGVLDLLKGGDPMGFIKPDGQQFWGIQR